MAGATENGLALVFASDENFAQGLAVAMHSALVNLSPTFAPEIYVLDNGLSESSRTRLRRVADTARRGDGLRWIQVPAERLEHLPTFSFSPASYSRLLIPEVIPQHVRRAVYLDADVLVLRDISPLFTIELAGAPLGAVWSVDPFGPEHRAWHGTIRDAFNAGVLVMDLERWRMTGLAERAMQYAATSSEPLFAPDQIALNAVAESWYELDYRWNLQHTILFWGPPPPASCEQFVDLYRRRWDLYRSAAVLHFVGAKPWQPWCTTPGATAWVRGMARTGWYSRRGAAGWMLHWGAGRARFVLGTTRKRWWARIFGKHDPTAAGWSQMG